MSTEPVKLDRSEQRRFEIKGKGWLVTQWMEPSSVPGFASAEPTDDDPFAEPAPTERIREQFKLKEVEVPGLLKPWFGRKVWDLRNGMKAAGVLENSSIAFAAYDPATQRIFLYSERHEDLDRFEGLFLGGCNRPPKHVVVTLDGKGQSRLLGRSGQKAHLSRSIDAGSITRSIEIEPTIGEDDTLIDLRINYKENSAPSSDRSINTAATLHTGTPLELLSGKAANTAESPPLRVKAEVQGVLD